MRTKRFISFLLMLAVLFSVSALAASTSDSKQVSSVVNLSVEPAQMTVTVPAVLPVSIDAEGTMWTASDAIIDNSSHGPVCVTNIRAEPVKPWTLVDVTHDFTTAKVNSTALLIQLDGLSAGSASQFSMPDGQIAMSGGGRIIEGNSSCYFGYYPIIPAQEQGFTGSLASIVFTIDWYKAQEIPLESLSIAGPATVMKNNAIGLVAAKSPSGTTNTDEITWTSSNPAVATVGGSGVFDCFWTVEVSGVSAGTATITASCGDKTASYTVTVTGT